MKNLRMAVHFANGDLLELADGLDGKGLIDQLAGEESAVPRTGFVIEAETADGVLLRITIPNDSRDRAVAVVKPAQ